MTKPKAFLNPILILSIILASIGTLVNPPAVLAQSGCSTIYNGGNGWVMDMCATDPNIPTAMEVLVGGVSQGNAALVRIYHQTQSGPAVPQVAVIYASGYVRLKQNADPSPFIPFGTSFILGPAYWPDSSTYYNHPQLTRLEVDTTWLPNAPLRMLAQGANHAFNVTYEMTLPPPRDRQVRLHVVQTYTATADITIDPTRQTERQGFKLVQASSMYINEGGTCDGGYSDCHDSNAARFIGNDLARHQVAFSSITAPGFIFAAHVPLGSTWLDVLHTDDLSWHSTTGAGTSGNTPNARIALDDLPTTTITPQGWIDATTDPNDDNVTLWLNDDNPESASWLTGESDHVGYWLLAQDNPPAPWAELDLRTGSTFLDFEGSYDCFPVKDGGQSTTATVAAIGGYTNTALQLSYNLGNGNGNWAQVRCNFDPPLDLSAYDHLRFDWRGDPAGANSLQVGLINPVAGGGENIFARGYHHASQHAWWGQMALPFNFLESWTAGTQFDASQVSALFISVVKDPVDDTGGAGSIALDNLNAFNVGSRTVPADFESVTSNPVAAQAAADWLASQQRSTGLLKSWQEEGACLSHTYDQALALIVFADRGMWSNADKIVDALAATQNPDGSWFKSRNCDTLAQVDSNKWEGDIAWAIYALSRYLNLGGTHPQAPIILQKGADWLATRVNPTDGCLVIDHTEGTIDAWWAFQAAGAGHASDADKIKHCLLTYYWDDTMGRFKGGRNWQQPYLDNQTWGAAFLKAVGETGKARRALSYAWEVLRLSAQGWQLWGLDGQAGPWSVWNEGTGQYIAVGGKNANDLLQELLAQQEKNGAMVGSPDEFGGGGVWTTRWHGVAPTAWLYNALCREPFPSITISGHTAAAGTILRYTDGTAKTAIADGKGNYSFNVSYNWTGTVTPSKTGVVFTPVNRSYTKITTPKTGQNYSATLTFPSVGAQDGWVLESSENSGVGGTMNSAAATINLGDDAAKKQYRGILSFSTGLGLPDTAVITGVTLKVKKQGIIGGGNPVTIFQGFMVDIKKGFFGTAMLQTGDFQAAASKSYGPFNTALVGDWYSINLTGAGVFINKLATNSGLTQIRLRFKLDDNNNAVANILSLYSGNAPAAANRPQLIITYTLP